MLQARNNAENIQTENMIIIIIINICIVKTILT